MSAKLYLEGYQVDISQEIDVDFTFSISDIKEVDKRNTSYSKSMNLPNTSNNQKIFGYIFDISTQTDYDSTLRNVFFNFNPAKQAKAQLFVNNVMVYDGVLRLIEINNTDGNITYNVNLFGKLYDILSAMGERTLTDIDWSDYNHIYDWTNVNTSWYRNEWVSGEQNYVYPLIDYGYTTDGIEYPLRNFKPALFVREIIQRIFDSIGFQFYSPFFDTEYFKRLIIVCGEKEATRTITNILSAQSFVPININFYNYYTSVNQIDAYYDKLIYIDEEVIKRYNNTDPTTGLIHSKFEVQNVPEIKVKIHIYGVLKINRNSRRPLNRLIVNLFKQPFAGSEQLLWYQITEWNFNDTGNEIFITYDATIETTIHYVDNIRVNFECATFNPDLPPGPSWYYPEFELTIREDNFINIYPASPVAINIGWYDNMIMNNIVPKNIKQKDFLKSIILMHNLYITPNKIQDKLVELVPYPFFYDNALTDSLDWTHKLDHSQEITIKPISELNATEYRFAYANDNDYWSEFYRTKYQEGYGEQRVIVDNDFQKDIQTTSLIFGSPVMRQQFYDRKIIHLYKVDNNVKKPDNFKPRIAYWGGLQPCTSWVFQGNVPEYDHTLEVYPYAGHIDDPIVPTLDLLFSVPIEIYFEINVYPSANLYNAYWKDLINAIASKNSRMLIGKFYLNQTDIMNLNFKQIIRVGKHYYQLHKVDKYNPIADSLSEVHLFKILSGLEGNGDFILQEDNPFLLQEDNSRIKQ